MTNTATAATTTLVAEDFGRGNEDRLMERLADHIVSVDRSERTDRDRTITTLRITLRGGFDGIRNTVAHGIGCSSGFICFCE